MFFLKKIWSNYTNLKWTWANWQKSLMLLKQGYHWEDQEDEDQALHQGKYLQPNFEVKSVELLSC